MPPMPFSQLCGVFHGRTEAFSGSVLAQPLTPANIAPNTSSNSQLTARRFISGSRMCGTDFVALNHLAEFPTGEDIGNGAVFLNAPHDDFGDKFAVAADQKLAVLLDPLIIADVQHDKVPFGVHHQNPAFQVG